jgi:predicted AAA+ superfamily ATPase
MKRLIDWHLKEWKTESHRKPLLLRGARQVGKTFALRNLGKTFKNFVEVNFEYLKDAKKIFEKDLRFSAQNYLKFDQIISKPLYHVFSLGHEDQKESFLSLLH